MVLWCTAVSDSCEQGKVLRIVQSTIYTFKLGVYDSHLC